MTNIVVIAHDLRSTHNVGSIFRTAEGLGVDCLYLTGYSPYPICDPDVRIPHLAKKIDQQIEKTALGATKMLRWQHQSDVEECIRVLIKSGFSIIGLEQAKNSITLPEFRPTKNIALLIGNELEGLPKHLLQLCNSVIEIPMLGQKESFNVVQATAMALYQLRYH